jgi:hypothetical protein
MTTAIRRSFYGETLGFLLLMVITTTPLIVVSALRRLLLGLAFQLCNRHWRVCRVTATLFI